MFDRKPVFSREPSWLDGVPRIAVDTSTTTRTPLAAQTLPYERIDSSRLVSAIRLYEGEQLLVLQPFGWHIDGSHIPNAAEHFSRESVCREHNWEVVADFGPYVAIVMARKTIRATHA